ncbi:MAG: protein TolR [Gammaproteobacteria bacterium]
MSEINVVPYIDVMLVLLVIFMVTAPLLTQGVRVDLPQTQAQAIKQSDSEPLILTVDATGRYYLNIGEDPLEPLTTEVLTTRVQAALQLEPQRRVLVRGDDSVSYGEVVHAMALLQQAGARGVGLITRSPSG